ncbi:D-alanyl-D-alanine carboxypeptidase family protein [Paracoccus sulfuroxidans]|uniref:D-alanyl-D-alanine carboxypeptidase n=1 Tax=Paracoccus sulfuroxidans TaxID=384678 RepID=A0A562NL44_9RHOB|nr:D-alanyl-D-alanine carboxypeptidase family protein [Paracoccus sulfuroxidans]TWI32878.1 D-alanyl-D-alanine carboxypeptidase [Paracoccus sulfuroxidans]
MAAISAPYAAYVMDARTGQEIYAQNADTRLHPASLTKMMTLYLAFSAIERGQVRLDSKFLVSTHAANQAPSRLGLKPGQRIELRYLIRAAAVKSANDAATTIGEGLAGSESKFAEQMTQMARALGMRNTHFQNANGLTATGHYSSARDMSLLGRHLFYDFPQYYSIFSRRTADAGIANVANTNRRFLDSYEGADGIKTGYTRAAGFNLTASAKRGNKRIIATVLGGNSTAHRNAMMAQLLDAGFGSAPNRVRETRPAPPQVVVERRVRRTVQVAANEPVAAAPQQGQTIRMSTSSRPTARASSVAVVTPAAINAAVERAQRAPAPAAAPPVQGQTLSASARPTRKPGSRQIETASVDEQDTRSGARPDTRPEGDQNDGAISNPGLSSSARPVRSPRSDQSASLAPAVAAPGAAASLFVQSNAPQPESLAMLNSNAPAPRTETIILASMTPEDMNEPSEQEIVSRSTNAGGRNYGVSLGLFRSQGEAEQLLLQTALQESASLGTAARQVANTKRGFQANFVGMNKETAELTCNRLSARQQSCVIMGP